MDDRQLLKDFVDRRSQGAFATLVERHIHFVYSTCLREVSDAALAEDVTQVVFLLLAKKASALRPGTVLSGWLFNAARFAARDALKREVRQQRRDHKAAQEMRELTNDDAAWRDIEPLLHDAIATLGEEERNAVFLRFFESKSLRETGIALGIYEDAARMRVARAVPWPCSRCWTRSANTSSAAWAICWNTWRLSQSRVRVQVLDEIALSEN